MMPALMEKRVNFTARKNSFFVTLIIAPLQLPFVKHHAVCLQLLLQGGHIQSAKILGHGGGNTGGLAGNGAAGDHTHDVPHTVSDGGAAAGSNEIFDGLGIDYKLKDGRLTVKGGLKSGSFSVDGNISSQFITGLLFALPLLDGKSKIEIRGGLSSKAYIDITLDVLKKYGIKIENNDYKSFIIKGNQRYKNCNYTIEGDFSQAAFFLAAGALGCDVTVSGLKDDSLQGDKKILDIISMTGAKVVQNSTSKFVAVPTADMHGITVDADEIPDLVPILAVMLSFIKGESRIINAGRLRIKESDRLSAICSELKKLGADIEEGDDFLIIRGRQVLNGAEVTSHNDHRITMAMAIAACRCEGNVVIDGARNSVTKSYPNFFEDYKKLGGKVK